MTALESKSSRPIRVDLPSSTEPAVAMRNKVAINCAFSSSRKPLQIPSLRSPQPSEIALSLAVFHASLGNPVVGAGCTPFGQPRNGRLGDHLGYRARRRLDAAGARDVADGAEPHGLLDDFLVLARLQVLVHREEHAVALKDLALVGVVDRRQLDLLGADVGPDVELGPVGQRERPDVLALVVPAVVQVPQFGPLHLGVPLAELVAEAEHPFLGPRLLLVAARTSERGVELVLPDGTQQREGLL